jgi:hypothetical protein
MSRRVVLVVVAGVALVGWFRLVVRLAAWRRAKRFAQAYLMRFRQLAEAYDEETYAWLLRRAARMQEHLGGLGLIARAATPYEPAPVSDTPVLPTTLRSMRSGTARPEAIATCEDALVQRLGVLDDERADHVRDLLNPLRWLGEGIRFLVLLPILALHGFGLVRRATVERFVQSTLFNVLVGIALVLILGTAGAILVMGWGDFVALLRQWTAAYPG